MSKAIRNGKIYESGSVRNHCHYLKDGFVFDHESRAKHKVLLLNNQKVRV